MKNLLAISIFCFLIPGETIAQNVGIGTLTPNDKFSVVNALPGYGMTHTHGPVTMGTYISNLYGQFGTKTNHPLQFFTNNGNAQLTLLQNGNFGIGLTAPTNKLDVYGSIKTRGANAEYNFDDRSNANSGYTWFSNLGSAKLFRYGAVNENALIVTANNFIGIETMAPQANLHINPAGAGSILIGTDKNTGGYTALEMGTSQQSGGYSYLQSTKASGSLYGTLALNPNGGDITVATRIGIGTNTPFSPLDIIQPANQTPALRILETGHIWGMYTNDNLVFAHNGTTRALISYADGSYHSYSDRRLKKNISEITPVLQNILKLSVKKYQFNDVEDSDKYSTGFIAQDAKELFPELVRQFKRSANDSTLYYGINYAGFSVIAIKAIQEQQQQIEVLQKEIDLLKEQMKAIIKNQPITTF